MKKLGKLYLLHRLILSKNSGTPQKIAQSLHISRASFFRYKDHLEALGAEIVWIHCWQTYLYANNFDLDYEGKKVRYEKDGTMRTRKIRKVRKRWTLMHSDYAF